MSVAFLFFFVAPLAAAISSLLGRDFLSAGLEELAGEVLLGFGAVLASGMPKDAASSFGLDFTLASGTE